MEKPQGKYEISIHKGIIRAILICPCKVLQILLYPGVVVNMAIIIVQCAAVFFPTTGVGM